MIIGITSEIHPCEGGKASFAGGSGTFTVPCGGAVTMRGGRLKDADGDVGADGGANAGAGWLKLSLLLFLPATPACFV